METFWIGIVLELLAGSFGTVGKQLVSYSARLSSPQRALRIKLFGFTVTTLFGPLADASAYAFAAQSVVAPLNGLDVVWNTLSAPFTLGEELAAGHVVGAALVASGASLTAVFGPHDQNTLTLRVLEERFLSPSFAAYVAAFAVLLFCSAQTLTRYRSGTGSKARAVALGGTAGAIAGNMFFLSSLLGVLRSCLNSGDWSIWTESPLPCTLLLGTGVVAISNIPLISSGLQEYEAVFMVPLFEGCHIIVACISGQVVSREMGGAELWRIALYWLSVLMIIAGLGAIQTTAAGTICRRHHSRDLEPEPCGVDTSPLLHTAVPLSFGEGVAEWTRQLSKGRANPPRAGVSPVTSPPPGPWGLPGAAEVPAAAAAEGNGCSCCDEGRDKSPDELQKAV